MTCAEAAATEPRTLQAQFMNSTTIITNIFVFLDTFWPYHEIVDYVNFVVEGLNINPHASAITLLDGHRGSVIVNTTNYLSDYYAQWNETTHSQFPHGFDLPVVLNRASDLAQQVMDNDLATSSLGGQSMIALLMPSPLAYLTESSYDYCMQYMEYINYTVPDLTFIYFAGGAVVRYKNFVRNPHEDLFPLNLDMSVAEASTPVVERLWRVQRRIANPRCGSTWQPATRGSNELRQYARLGSRNFYRLMPNYFFGYVSMRYLKVEAISGITFTICTSRTIVLPFRNSSSDPPNQQCSQITINSFSYDLTDICSGADTIQQCEPLYISVQAQVFADTSQVSCMDEACQTPVQAQYKIFVNNLNCNGASRSIFSSGLLTTLLATTTLMRWITR